MDNINESDEPAILKILLERVKSGEVSIDEASQYLWIKPIHMMKEARLEQELKNVIEDKNQPIMKRPRGKPKGHKSPLALERQSAILNLWIDMVENGEPERGGKMWVRRKLCELFSCEVSTVENVINAWNGFKKGQQFFLERNIKLMYDGDFLDLVGYVQPLAEAVDKGEIVPSEDKQGVKFININKIIDINSQKYS